MTGQIPLLEQPGKLTRLLAIGGGVYLALYGGWLIAGQADPAARELVAGLAMLFSALVAAACAWLARAHQAGGRSHAAWTWLAGGLSLGAAADLLRVALPVNGTPANAAHLLGIGFLCVALGLSPRVQRASYSFMGLLIDAGLSAAAAVTLVWLAIAPAGGEPALVGVRTLTGWLPMADLAALLLLLAIFLLSDARSLAASTGLLALGLGLYAAADLVFAYLSTQGQFAPGTVLDMVWVLGDGMFALAAVWHLRSANPPAAGRGDRRWLKRLQGLLPPLLAILLGWVVLFDWQFRGVINQAGLWVTLALALGLIARQGIRAGEVEMEKYASLVNSVAVPAFVCDRRGRLQLVNPALLRAAVYDQPADVMGRSLDLLLEGGVDVAALLRDGLEGGWEGEIHLRRSNGELFPVALALRPLTSDGERPGGSPRLALAGTAHDLTELKRQQQALQAAYEQIAADRSELERLNARLEDKVLEKTAALTLALAQLERQNLALQQLDELKSDFVSMVSHELRAPLTNINSGIELLLAGAYPVPGPVAQNLELVQSEIRRLSRFVETILDLSALDAGRMPLYPAPLSLQSLVVGLRQQLERTPGGERLLWDIPVVFSPLLADEQALNSIFFHLIDNAMKYAPEGAIVVSAAADGGMACLRVMDHGPGIDEEALPLLFDRFYRSNPADAQTVYGHGLGLYIVQRLTEAMNGRVSVVNAEGGGACFSIWLPFAVGEGGDDAP